jgi:5,6,7,8-tetrahydromethanopterin hydro-lyase
VHIGEGFAGHGANAAHVNTVLGAKEGPVGTAWATALATPREGHVPFVAVLQPNMPVKPMTLFVNKATVARGAERHATLTWGAAQAGVAAGVVDAVRKGIVLAEEVDELLLIVAVWVSPDADDDQLVFANNESATLAAIAAGRDDLPSIRTVLEAEPPSNPYFRP